VIGFVRYGEDPGDGRAGHVHALYVDPERSGRGHGRQLLERALADLARRGHDVVTLWVFEASERARRFYAAAGFVPAGATLVAVELQHELRATVHHELAASLA